MRALVIPFGSLRSRVCESGRLSCLSLASQAMSLEVRVGAPCQNRIPLPEVRSGTAAWSSDSTLLRAFSCRSRMSKSRWVASILEMLSFFLGWRFPDSRVALMGVLVSGGLASGGSLSSARLTVGTYGGNRAHLEPTGGIPSGRPVGHIP